MTERKLSISRLAKLVFAPGSLIKVTKEMDREKPPKTEAERELSAYTWAGVIGLEVGRVGLYLAPILLYLTK